MVSPLAHASCWLRLAEHFRPNPADAAQAAQIEAQLSTQGYLKLSCAAALALPDPVLAQALASLAARRSHTSPVAGQASSNWMTRRSFCFMNVRATGQADRHGSFLTAAKLLLALRADAIHLGPFTAYDHQVIYAPTHLRTLSPHVVDHRLWAAGFAPEDQLRAFVEAAHLLGKVVGFDLEPHVSQFAVPVIEHPGAFRWTRVGLAQPHIGDEAEQAAIAAEVASLRDAAFAAAGLRTLEAAAGDTPAQAEAKLQQFHQLVGCLIARGLWPVLCQAWNAHGTPAFRTLHPGGYPQFFYRGPDGHNAADYAYPILAPYKFYTDLPENAPPTTPPARNPAGVALFRDAFAYWRDDFGFDFVRYDSVDHVFDSVVAEHADWPAADRPTPALLREAIAASRAPDKPWIGNLAERMGNELDDYASLGFDLLLGNDMMCRIDAYELGKSFAIHDRLLERHAQGLPVASICFALDTHDTGNGFLWGDSLIRLMGPQRMRLRHFVARALNVGVAARPMYEVMGLADGSHGLYPANIGEINLEWVGDSARLAAYHRIEDIFTELAPQLHAGQIVARHVQADAAWWIIATPAQTLVAIVALEKADDAPVPYLKLEHPRLHGPLREFDFNADAMHDWGPIDGCIEVWQLPHCAFRLFTITHG